MVIIIHLMLFVAKQNSKSSAFLVSPFTLKDGRFDAAGNLLAFLPWLSTGSDSLARSITLCHPAIGEHDEVVNSS